MILQNIVWTIALVGMGLIALGFIYVISQAGRTVDEAASIESARTSGVLRKWLFAALLVIFVAGSWATLRRFPIPPQNRALDAGQVVDVVASQWFWQVTPPSVRSGSTVEFRVTSTDVNHGLAIYSPEGHILIQTQAMPGYTNKLLYTFDQPGVYTLQCLEFCGVGHGPMKTTLRVVAAIAE
ncbi:MAG: hypothetical protein MNPFHGCM_00013 [Gemmatimonadaceae bacterium]|nr:hypothetical protein [Gemmatimonadaceae bacterium]